MNHANFGQRRSLNNVCKIIPEHDHRRFFPIFFFGERAAVHRLLPISIRFECSKVPLKLVKEADWYFRLRRRSIILISASVGSSQLSGIGRLLDGSQNAVWTLALEDEFRRITKIAVMAK